MLLLLVSTAPASVASIRKLMELKPTIGVKSAELLIQMEFRAYHSPWDSQTPYFILLPHPTPNEALRENCYGKQRSCS
jgi:hypothetical protein